MKKQYRVAEKKVLGRARFVIEYRNALDNPLAYAFVKRDDLNWKPLPGETIYDTLEGAFSRIREIQEEEAVNYHYPTT